eukprot:scaffold70188_cov42-Phaeocystis_antarctica.AAC.1
MQLGAGARFQKRFENYKAVAGTRLHVPRAPRGGRLALALIQAVAGAPGGVRLAWDHERGRAHSTLVLAAPGGGAASCTLCCTGTK